MFNQTFIKISTITILLIFLSNCGGLSKTDARKIPTNAQERARKNVEEGRAAGLGNILGKGGTNFEFSTSNPLWRASLEILDFIPMTTVDYAGGMIISDWYTDNNANFNESIKISIRFLSNEIRSDSIKIIVHKKNCDQASNCTTSLVGSNLIKDELRSTILKKASLFEKADKQKK